MPVHIRVRDFQSLDDVELVIERFTVVTGPNNSGKTALQRAVQGVFTNPSGDAFVRYGAERLIVDVDFGNDETVRWEKGPKVKPKYTVKGKEIHPGRQVPDEVLALGVQPIQAGSLSIWPQVAPQFTGQVFLLDLPGSAVAEAVADVERVGKLTQALRLAESDKRSATAELKVRRKDLAAIESTLGDFSGLDIVASVVEAVELSLEAARAVLVEIQTAVGLRTRMQAAQDEIKRLEGIRNVQLPTFEEVAKVAEAGRNLAQVRAIHTRLKDARTMVSKLEGVQEVKVPTPPKEAQEVRASIKEAMALKLRLSKAQSTLTLSDKVKEALTSFNEAEIQRKIELVSRNQKALTYLEGIKARLGKASTEIATLKKSIVEKEGLSKSTDTEIREVLGGLGSCPVCQSAVSGIHSH